MQQEVSQAAPRGRVGGQVRALLSLGLPLVGSHIAQMLIGVTDTVMMGWYSVPGLAALSLSGPLFFIIFIFGSGFAWAVTPMVATAFAQDDDRQVRRVTRMGLWLSIGYGALMLPLFFFIEPILLAIGQEPEVAALAGDYLPWMGLGLVPALLVQTLKSYLSALELTRVILYAAIGAALLNILANYAFIFGNFGAPEMGIVGAGIASLFSHVVGLLVLIAFILKRRPEHELLKNFQKPDPEALTKVFRLGIPIGLTVLAESGLFAATGIMMGWLGTLPLAAHGIALQITSVTFMIPLGLSQAVTVRIGREWGRQDQEALRAAALAGGLLTGIAILATVAAFLLLPEFLVGLFIDPTDPSRPEILAMGVSLLMVAALFQLADNGQVLALGLLRGVQDTKVPMMMAIISYWLIGLPVAYLLGFPAGLGGPGIWLGLTVGLSCAFASMQYRFWTRYAKPSSPGRVN